MKEEEGFEVWLDEENGWKMKSTQHTIDVIRESDSGNVITRKYTNSIESAIDTYIDERTKRFNAETLEELKDELVKLNKHISNISDTLKEIREVNW